MQEQAIPRLNWADGGGYSWDSRGSPQPQRPVSPGLQVLVPHRAFSKNAAGIKAPDYSPAGRRGEREGKQRRYMSWTLGIHGLPGHLTEKAWGSWVSATATCTDPSKFQRTLPCMLLFLLFQFIWPLECHPKDPL